MHSNSYHYRTMNTLPYSTSHFFGINKYFRIFFLQLQNNLFIESSGAEDCFIIVGSSLLETYFRSNFSKEKLFLNQIYACKYIIHECPNDASDVSTIKVN